MSIVDISTNVDAMISFFDREDVSYYIGIGGKTAWDEDDTLIPPEKKTDKLTYGDTLLLTPVEEFVMCALMKDTTGVDITTGEYINYNNMAFKVITDRSKLYQEEAHYIYFCAYLTYVQVADAFAELGADQPTTPFRKAALFSNPTKKNTSKITRSGILIPDGVGYEGTLQNNGQQKVYSQFAPIYRGADKREKLTFMLQF